MKKQMIGLSMLFFIACNSRRHTVRSDTHITLTESDRYYSMDARFNNNKTREIEKYMDEKFGRRNNISFLNTRIDGRLTLDDHTTFIMKKNSGHVKIKLDKRDNSFASYRSVKSFCEGVAELLK